MSSGVSRIVAYVIAALALYYSFSINIWLGILVIVAIIGWMFYTRRDGFLLQKALQENKRGNTAEALRILDQAKAANPHNPAVLINYGYLLLKEGKLSEAAANLEQAEREFGQGKLANQIGMTLALVRWKQGRLDDAIAMLEKVQAKINNTTLYGSLGYLYIEQGDLERALVYNTEAVEYNDTDAVIADNLLLTHIAREEWAEAAEVADKLLAIDPKFPEAYYHSALVQLHAGDRARALALLDEALARPFTAVSTVTRETVSRKRDELDPSGGDR